MPTDFEHPFAEYLEKMRDRVSYRAAIPDGAFGEHGRVIGRSPGGAVTAAEVAVGGGRVVFLPAYPANLTHSERAEIARSLVAAVRNSILTDAEDDPPYWLSEYPLPGLAEADSRLEDAEAKMDEVESELIEARNAYRKIDNYRRLLWQEGKYGLDLPMRDALGELGFASLAQPDEPASMMFMGEIVLVEIEGAVDSIGMNPHYRLRQRLEQRIAEGRRVKGLIIVNGQRTYAPASRTKPFDDSLRIAAESMRYCVVEAVDVFNALKAKLEGTGNSAAFCRALIETEGVFKPQAAGESSATTNES